MQTGMKLDSKTPECRKFLIKLMDQLESVSPALRNLFSQSRLCHMSRVRLPLTFYNLNVLGGGFFGLVQSPSWICKNSKRDSLKQICTPKRKTKPVSSGATNLGLLGNLPPAAI